MKTFFIIVAPALALVSAWYLGYWVESGNKVRFSLRALLITMTVVAIILGWIAYTARK